MSDTVPNGCLACNHDEVATFLAARGHDLERYWRIPPALFGGVVAAACAGILLLIGANGVVTAVSTILAGELAGVAVAWLRIRRRAP